MVFFLSFFFNLLVFRCLLISFTLQFLLNSVFVHLAPLLSQLHSGQRATWTLLSFEKSPPSSEQKQISVVWWGLFFWSRRMGSKTGFNSPHRVEKNPLKSEELKEVKWALCLCLALWSPGPGRLRIDQGRSGLDWGSSRGLWGDSPSWGPFPGQDTGLRAPWSCSRGRALTFLCLSCWGFPAPACGTSLPGGAWAAPPAQVCRQHCWNATNYYYYPVNWLPLCSQHFSRQRAGGSRCYSLSHNKCSCGDQRSRDCRDFFSFLFVPWKPQ